MSRSRSITIDHNGATYYGQVATIDGTMLGGEDHGILTAYLYLKGDGWGTGVGGYALDSYDESKKERVATAYGLDHIVKLTWVVGVTKWEDLPGQRVVVLYEKPHPWGGVAAGLAHIEDEDRVLILKEHAESWRDETGAAS